MRSPSLQTGVNAVECFVWIAMMLMTPNNRYPVN
jgi:hypothetical protein